MPLIPFARPGRLANPPALHSPNPLRARLALLTATARLAAITLLAGPAMAQPTPPSLADDRGCAVLWQVAPLLAATDAGPPQLHIGLRFNGGQRQQTKLHLPAGWDGLTALASPAGETLRLRMLPNEPAWRSVAHAPGDTVQLQWQLVPSAEASQGGSTQLTPTWFAFSGQGVLPMPDGADDPHAGPACVRLQGLPAGSRWATSHGTADGPEALFVLPPSPVPLAQRVQQALYAGGALQLQRAPGVVAVLPEPAPWQAQAGTLASAAAQALATQQQWPQAPTYDAPPWLLLVLPTAASVPADAALASAWYQALALQLPPAWAGDGAAVQRLLTPALARAWMADRFGPLAHAGRGDAPLRAWFAEGWADFLAHRSLLRTGLWTADDYAAALNARIATYLADPARSLPNVQLAAGSGTSPVLAAQQALRGEWLALQWHQALRRAGHPGLDAVLRQQWVAADQARREGPISAPLATHRVVATLRGVLREQALRDVELHIDQGQPFDFKPDSLGPCFVPATGADTAGPATVPAYRAVPNALQHADCQAWLRQDTLADAPTAARVPPDRAAIASVACKPGAKGHRKAGARAQTRCSGPALAASRAKAGVKAGTNAPAASVKHSKGAKKPPSKSASKAAAPATKPKATKAAR